jgi:hypothetical protein
MKGYRLLLPDSKGRLVGSRAVQCITDSEAIALADPELGTSRLRFVPSRPAMSENEWHVTGFVWPGGFDDVAEGASTIKAGSIARTTAWRVA